VSHPFQHLRDDGHNRVSKITHGDNTRTSKHSDVVEDKALIKSMVKPAALKAHGGPAKARLDRPAPAKGGRVGKTTVNIVIADKGKQDQPMPPMMPPQGAAPLPPPKPPMPPMGGPPGMPPGAGMPPGMPMRKAGGRVAKKSDGGSLSSTRTFREGIDYSDPDSDKNYHNKGSRGALDEAIDYARSKSDRSMGDGPTRYNAALKRKAGGRIKSGPAWAEGLKNGTPVEHSPGKNDTKLIDHSRAKLTRKTGGRIEASDAKGPKMTAGADTGKGRLEKTALQKRK